MNLEDIGKNRIRIPIIFDTLLVKSFELLLP